LGLGYVGVGMGRLSHSVSGNRSPIASFKPA
jgi:hypothetical protein